MSVRRGVAAISVRLIEAYGPKWHAFIVCDGLSLTAAAIWPPERWGVHGLVGQGCQRSSCQVAIVCILLYCDMPRLRQAESRAG